MKLSVIVPIYNVEKYLRECLDSLVLQNKKDIIFLLIDDGSKDNSTNIAKEYVEKDSRFLYFNKKNGGLSDARNYGVSKTDSDYVFFVDADDIVAENAIAKIEEKLSNSPDCVVFDVKYFWEESDKTKIVPGIYDVDSDIKGKLLASAPSAWNKVFKRELLLKYPEPVGRYYEDLASTPLIVSECERIEYINEPLYFYRQRKGSIIYSFNEKCFDIFKDFEEVLVFYKEKNLFDKYYEVLESLVIEHLLLYANKRFVQMNKPYEYLKRSTEFINKYFNNPLDNKYYKRMNRGDKLFIRLAYEGKVKLIKTIIKIKKIFK